MLELLVLVVSLDDVLVSVIWFELELLSVEVLLATVLSVELVLSGVAVELVFNVKSLLKFKSTA